MSKKLKVGFISNSPLIKTGLSRNIKALLPILYKTEKYEIFMLNQSMPDGEQNYQRFPWNNEGAIKNFDQNRFNSDSNYQRWVAYGNAAVGDWVVRNRLDVVLFFDDPWGADLETYIKSDWYNFIKNNFLFDITLDSEPIIGQGKELAKNCPNFHVWSGFAERLLKIEDAKLYSHVKTMRGAIDSSQFRILPKEERLELRHKFNIKDDEKIIFYLGRNQLRKNSFHANQEALAIWKQKYPDRKVRLLFHTKFCEPNGWPINQIREELKLNKEDILCTYFCRNCQDWNIQPHDGEDLNCPKCNAQKSRTTAGIDSTINEHDLNKIYNIADACCSSFTSGGQEYNLVESMLSGLPLACPDYSCGEDFILSGFVKEIQGSYYREFNTSFQKFTPNINSIVEFYEYIWDLKEENRQKLINDARNWAIKEFDANNISKQIENFIDSRKQIDWDIFLNKKKELKNINAQIEDKQSDTEFIDHCYKTILNMDLPESDGGKIHWANFLKQNRDRNQLRQELVNAFRNAAAQHNQKVQPKVEFSSFLIHNKKKQFLIVCPESAGDCLYASATLKSFRESYPQNEWNLYLATKPEFMELFDCNPYLDKVLEYMPFMDSEITILGQGSNLKPINGYCFITAQSQKFLNYLGNHNINLKLS